MLAALCLAMVFAISLSSYIALCYVSLAMSTRNVVSGHSSELAEAGIEQAIYASNNSDWTGWTSSSVGGLTTQTTAMTMTSSGLVATSTNPTPLNFGNGSNGTANITVTYSTLVPTAIQSITSQGVMTLPRGSIISGVKPSISQTLTYNGPSLPSTASAPIFVNSVAATSGKLKFSNGGSLDSYNSNPSSGTYQTYSSSVAGYSAVLASLDNSTATATVAIKSAVVHGYATGYDYSSPSSTNWFSYMVSAGKLVGPNTAAGTYIDTSREVTSPVPYQPMFPEVSSLPSPTVYLGNQTASIVLGNPAAVTPTVYDVNLLSVGSNTTVNVVGPVVIIAYGSVSISGTGAIVLSTPQASLQIFQEYGSITIGGNGITNTNVFATTGISALAKRVSLLSTNNSSFTATVSTTTPFYGVIYFPYMPVTVSSDATIYGSIVGSAVSLTGKAPTIHYDNALRSPDSTVGDAAFANITAPITVSGLVSSVP